jgi:hypothetical protein
MSLNVCWADSDYNVGNYVVDLRHKVGKHNPLYTLTSS